MSKLHTYKSKDIIVTYDAARCTHEAECLKRLPQVFNTDVVPWIQPENAGANEIAEAVRSCPTGALHYQRVDGGAEETPTELNVILVKRNGPLHAQGDFTFIDTEGNALLKETRLSLCRCGKSENKPFCDDRHVGARFADPGKLGAVEKAPLEGDATGPVTIFMNPTGSLKFAGPIEIRGISGSFKTDKISFCRCGHSKNKPYCDGTHREFNWQTEAFKAPETK